MSKRIWIIVSCSIAGLGLLILGLTVLLPWLTDNTNPVLFVKNLTEQGFYNTDIPITIDASDKKGSLAYCAIRLDFNLVFVKKLSAPGIVLDYTLSQDMLTEGEHRLDIIAVDNSFRKNTTRVNLNFTFDKTAPVLHWASKTNKVEQGNVLPVYIQVPDEKEVVLACTFGKQRLSFYPIPFEARLYRALFAAEPFHKTGAVTLNIKAADKAGNVSESAFPIEILYKFFPSETITIGQDKAGLLTDKEATALNKRKMDEAVAVSDANQYWQGKFNRPARGFVTSFFGIQRLYNNGLISSYHKGLDIANKQDTTVLAANRGKVVLAEALPINGNCIIIDHGQRLFSMYFHLHKILVKPEQVVESGMEIGLMGTTGISTGPHLHWQMHIGEIAIDPEQWEDEEWQHFKTND